MLKNSSVETISQPEFIDITPVNDMISKCLIKVLYLGENRNHSFISKEVAKKMANTLPCAPIVGAYLKDKDDFGDHGRVITVEDGEVKISCKTVPYGFVAPDAKVWFQEFKDTSASGVETVREYMMTTGYLWTGQYPEIQKAIDEGLPQSMELDSDSLDGYWASNNNSGYEFFIINDAKFSKLCILGSDVEPCFEGASVTSLDQEEDSRVMTVQTSFSNEPEFVRTLLEMRNQLTYALQNEGGSYMLDEVKDEVIEEPITEFDEAGDTGSAENSEAATESTEGAEGETAASESTETAEAETEEAPVTPAEEVASELIAAAEEIDGDKEDDKSEEPISDAAPKKRTQENFAAEEEVKDSFACGKKKYMEDEDDKKEDAMEDDEQPCEESPCDPEKEEKYAGCGNKKKYAACGSNKKKCYEEDEDYAACGGKKKKCYEEDEDEDEDYAACGGKKKSSYSSEESAEVDVDHSLEDVEAEFAAVKAELETAKADYAALKSEFDAVNAELQSLREFKLGIENKEKDAEIAKYFMLSDEDKADIIAHKSEYSLDEIKSKLAVLYVEKNVDFSSLGESEAEESEAESEDPITTFSLEAPVDVNFSSTLPEWVEALREARK